MAKKSNKSKNPIGRYINRLCTLIYYVGLGDHWYLSTADKNASIWSVLYYMYSGIFYSVYVVIDVMETAAIFRTSLSQDYRADAAALSIGQLTILGKWSALIYWRPLLRDVMKSLMETTFIYEEESIMKRQMRRSKLYCTFIWSISYFTLTNYTVNGIIDAKKKGVTFRTLVTIYPDPEDRTLLANVFRGVIQISWWHSSTAMILTDSLSAALLIFVAFRFIELQEYFKSLRQFVLDNMNVMPKEKIIFEFRRKFICGVRVHKELLRCTQNIQKCFSMTFACATVQSASLFVTLLIRFMVAERTLTTMVMTFFFIVCVLLLLGTYYWNAGEITYEASKLPTAMYSSGWELCSDIKLKQLVTIATMTGQRPVKMTAFGVFELSYELFVSMVKTSYSIFAVLY